MDPYSIWGNVGSSHLAHAKLTSVPYTASHGVLWKVCLVSPDSGVSVSGKFLSLCSCGQQEGHWGLAPSKCYSHAGPFPFLKTPTRNSWITDILITVCSITSPNKYSKKVIEWMSVLVPVYLQSLWARNTQIFPWSLACPVPVASRHPWFDSLSLYYQPHIAICI